MFTIKKTIKEILEENGPILSSELAKIYKRENQTNNTNAWKATSRAKSPIGKDIVEKWLSEKIKDINQFLISVYPNKNFEYQFWSVRGF